MYTFAADVILVSHVLIVFFVVFGLVLVYVGFFLSWKWVRNLWFRITHLVAISVVVLQSWFGIVCPLTTWEMNLREKGGDITYESSFIAHWLNQILYYQAPHWVFVVCYTAFGALVVFSWLIVRPNLLRAVPTIVPVSNKE